MFAIDGGRAIEVHAVVVGKVERDATGTLRFDAQASRIDRGPDRRPVDVAVSISVSRGEVEGARLDLGSTVVASGTAWRSAPGERAVLAERARNSGVR